MSTSLYRQGAYTVSFDLNTFLMTGHAIAIGQRESMGNPCMNNYVAGDGRRSGSSVFRSTGTGTRCVASSVAPTGRRTIRDRGTGRRTPDT